MNAIAERELKETFAERVFLPVGLINYRAIEESIKGIDEVELPKAIMPSSREKLLKVRRDLKRILNGL